MPICLCGFSCIRMGRQEVALHDCVFPLRTEWLLFVLSGGFGEMASQPISACGS